MKTPIGGHGSTKANTDLYKRNDFPDEGTEGRFGRLFALGERLKIDRGENGNSHGLTLRPHPSPRFDLDRLGKFKGPMTLKDDTNQDSASPAGITFLAQFVDHDITLDVLSKFENPQINASLENARTPNLDLDCVYGGGRESSPHLYDGAYLIEGEDATPADDAKTADLPRNAVSRAIIGDPRNDENVLVSQVQAVFIRFHNRCVDELHLKDNNKSDELLFEEARDTTTHYYHRIVLEDLLYHIVGVDMIQDVSTKGRRYYFPEGFWSQERKPLSPYMPVEFSVAAYRFGHSQIRDKYHLNNKVDAIEVFKPRSSDDNENGPTLRGFDKLPDNFRADWSNFFPPPGEGATRPGFKIDPFLPRPLLELPTGIVPEGDAVISLASRNLLRGRTFRLPSGEAIANLMAADGVLVGHDPENDENRILDLSDPTTANNPAIRDLIKTLSSDYAMTETPLWLYILMEAAEFGIGFDPDGKGSGGGDRLGPVGGRIVAEVLMGLLDHYRDMSGKGLDYNPKIPYNFTEEPKKSAVTITQTRFGPRMSMYAFIEFAYACPLIKRADKTPDEPKSVPKNEASEYTEVEESTEPA